MADPQVIRFMGATHRFPAEFTQDQVSAALKVYAAQAKPEDKPIGVLTPQGIGQMPDEQRQKLDAALPEPSESNEQLDAEIVSLKSRVAAKTATSAPQPSSREALDYAKGAFDDAMSNMWLPLGGDPAIVTKDLPGVKIQHRAEKLTLDLGSAPKLLQFVADNGLLAASLQEDMPHLAWLERLDSGFPAPNLLEDPPPPDLRPAPRFTWSGDGSGLAAAHGVGRMAFGTLAALEEFISTLGTDEKIKSQVKARAEYFKALAGAPTTGPEKLHPEISKVAGIASQLPMWATIGKAGSAATFGFMYAETYGSLRQEGVSEPAAMTGAFLSASFGALVGGDFTKWLGGAEVLDSARATIDAAMRDLLKRLSGKELGKHLASGTAMVVGQGMIEDATEMLDRSNRTGKPFDVTELLHRLQQRTEDGAYVAGLSAMLGLKEHFEIHGKFGETLANATRHDMLTAAMPEEVRARPEDYRKALQAIYDDSRAVRMLEGFRGEAEARGADTGPLDEALKKARPARRAYLDPDLFEAVVKAAGGDPQEWATRLSGGDAMALTRAKQTETLLEIPMSAYLYDLKPIHDLLREGVASTADGETISRQEKTSDLVPPPRPEYLAKIAELLAKKHNGEDIGPALRDLAAREHAMQASGDLQEQPKAEAPKEEAPEPPSQTALQTHAANEMAGKTLGQIDSLKGVYTKPLKNPKQWAGLNQALEAARLAAQKRGKTAVDAIVKLAGKGAASEYAHAASDVHGEAVDALLAALGGAEGGSGPFDSALESLRLAGLNIEFDADLIRDAVENGTSVKDMTVAQAENARVALEALVAHAKEWHQTYVDGKQVPRGSEILEIANTLAKGTGKPPPGTPGEPSVPPEQPDGKKPGLLKRMLGVKSRTDAETASLHNLFHTLGRWGDTYRTRVIDGLFHRDQLYHQMKDAFEPVASLKDLGDVVLLPEGVRAGMPSSMTLGDMLLVRFQTGTREGMRDYSRGWGVEPIVIEKWLNDHMTKVQYDAVQEAWRRFKNVYEGYAQAHAIRSGGEVLRAESPRKIFTEHGTYDGEWGGPRRRKTVDAALPEEADPTDDPHHGNRDGDETGSKRLRVPVHSLEQFGATLASTAHDVAFSEISRDGWQMLRDPDFRAAVRRYKGDAWLGQIDGTHRLVSEGWTGQVRSTWHVDTLFPMLKASVAHSAFGMNLLVTGGQIAHEPLAAFALNINPVYMAAGLARARTLEGHTEAYTNSKFLNQYTSGWRGQLNEMIAQATGYRSKWNEVLNTPSMYLQEKMSTMLAHDIWQMSFAKHFDLTKDRAESYRRADLDASTAMPPTNILFQPAIVRDRTLGLFFLVRNFPATVFNLKAMDDWDSRTARTEGVQTLGQTRVGQIGRRLGLYSSLGLGLYLMGHGRNEEEQKRGLEGFGTWGLRTLLTEATYGSQITHMLMRDVGAPLLINHKISARDMHLFDSTLGELGGMLARDFQNGVHGPLDKKLLALADASARLFIPGGVQMLKYGEGAYRVAKYYRLGHSDFTHTPHSFVGSIGEVLAPNRRDSTPFRDIDMGVTR